MVAGADSCVFDTPVTFDCVHGILRPGAIHLFPFLDGADSDYERDHQQARFIAALENSLTCSFGTGFYSADGDNLHDRTG